MRMIAVWSYVALPAIGLLAVVVAGCGTMPPRTAARISPSREEVVRALNLVPMNDGACIGYYREMYACAVPAQAGKPRPAASSIYYLMAGGLFDPWHKLASDEILVYHAGVPMHQLLIYPDGKVQKLILGPDPTRGHQPQIIIPKGTWMGFRIADDRPEAWGLYSVICAPGFHLEDITISSGQDLGGQFPSAVAAMKELRMYQ